MYRTIDAAFWTDPKVRKLDTQARLGFLYLLTNPHSHVGGIYNLRLSYISDDTGFTDKVSMRVLDTLSDAGFIQYDSEKSVVWIVNMFRYQGSGEKNERAVANLLESLHGSPLVDAFLARYPTVRKYLDEPPRPKRIGIPNILRFKILERCKFTCVYCGVKAPVAPIEIDHRIPVSAGGTNDEDNLVAACWDCNNGKSAKTSTLSTDTLSEVSSLPADTLSSDTPSGVGTPNRNRTGTEQEKKGEGGAVAPTDPPDTLTFGEFGRIHITAEQHQKLHAKLNGSLDDYFRRFDHWVNEAPEAKANGIRRKDRHAYESIVSWYDRDVRDGKIKAVGDGRPTREEIDAAKVKMGMKVVKYDKDGHVVK